MQDHEMRGLLGPADNDTDLGQRAAISAAADRIDARWPDPDLVDTRRVAMTGALLILLGDDTLEGVADRMHAARSAYQDALTELTGALIASDGRLLQVRDGRGGGVLRDGSEVDLAVRAGVSRMTVRKALGK